jgi:methylenetetrahydrofolate dehydrogenase (NADP+)/methenyltetrahydrofolate cyclohydrolase
MIIDGRAIAADILASARESIAVLGRELVVRAVVMQPNTATESYLRMKSTRAVDAGMRVEIVRVSDHATTEEVISAVLAPGADAVIVQLPLPASVDTYKILNQIPLSKDADVLSAKAHEEFESNEPDTLLPPVVAAIKEVLERTNTSIKGKSVTVIGYGHLVGEPACKWANSNGAFVSRINKGDSLAELKNADIVISGAGSPHLITRELVKEGVVLIDAGTSESNGAIAGDAHPDCASVARVFTPVPGGMGPIAVACLFQNVALMTLRNTQKSVH